jgi:two-component system, OmpR family, sensor kinase
VQGFSTEADVLGQIVTGELSMQSRSPIAVQHRRSHLKSIPIGNDNTVTGVDPLHVDASQEQEQSRIRQILGAAAHELRGPLGAIVLFTELLEEDTSGQLSVSQKELVSNIHLSSQLVMKLIDDLMDASAVKMTRPNLCLQPVDVVSVVGDCIILNQGRAERSGIRVSSQCDGQLPTVKLDRLKILRAINELLRNAIRFSSSGSNVALRTWVEERQVHITVEDRGSGISPEVLQTLFSPVPKQAHARLPGERGLGLGLAIVRGIVAAHKGQIRVNSRPGAGSTFTLSLPTDLK